MSRGEDLHGKQVLRIHQRWDAADKSYVAIFDQIFEATGKICSLHQRPNDKFHGACATQRAVRNLCGEQINMGGSRLSWACSAC
jgi:hypothetical protein